MTLRITFSNKIQALVNRAQTLYSKGNWTMAEAEEFLALRQRALWLSESEVAENWLSNFFWSGAHHADGLLNS